MNRKQAMKKGRDAFWRKPEYEHYVLAANIAADEAGLCRYRDGATRSAFVQGFTDAHYEAFTGRKKEWQNKKN